MSEFLSSERKDKLLSCIRENNIPITDLNLFNTALTHSSYANESCIVVEDNERLEFLGDSVLQLTISSFLYSEIKEDEGVYTKLRSAIVSENALYDLALKLNISSCILMSKGEDLSGGRKKKALLADCVEAIIGAVFLSGGFQKASEFILNTHKDFINEVIKNRNLKDYKTLLQEYVQINWKKTPDYHLIKTEGPEHCKTFYYCVSFNNRIFGPVAGKNKKDAEQNVAMVALTELGIISDKQKTDGSVNSFVDI